MKPTGILQQIQRAGLRLKSKLTGTVLLLPVLLMASPGEKQVLTKFSFNEIPTGKAPVIAGNPLNIASKEGNFVDPTGRTLFLRGINLGGSNKMPFRPNGATHLNESFQDKTTISFTGRPFPIEQADEHFSRLKAWGFHFLRFLVTWEAIEHEGPGIYDREYLSYLKQLISKANDYGINVIIDPHQDVWSRFSGGDGAPLWVFESIGMEVSTFGENGAAIVHHLYGDPFPQMVWYTNNFKLASATLFTLFFGGNDFAPKTTIEGTPVQDYLQQHYISALAEVARVLDGLPNVLGFELMNEPSAGYIGIEDLTQAYHTEIVGDAPTPWQAILAGEGIPQTIDRFRVGAVALKYDGKKVLNPNKVSAWKNGLPGIWIQNGLGEKGPDGNYRLTDPGYFNHVDGQKIDFNSRYYIPFALKYAQTIRSINPNWIIVVDNVLFPYPHQLPDLKEIPGISWVNGSHWYDDVTLVKKKYMPYLGFYKGKLVFGTHNVQRAYEKTMADMLEETRERFGQVPAFLGEFGIPFDMNKRKAFRTNNFSIQAKALDRSFRVVEKNGLNYTLWNYTADNNNERGDNWNGEDLSVFSRSQQTQPGDINSGGRALNAAVRPYPKKIPGTLTEYDYNYRTRQLKIRYTVNSLSPYPAEIFLPVYVYGEHFTVWSTAGKLAFDASERLLLIYPEQTGTHEIIIK